MMKDLALRGEVRPNRTQTNNKKKNEMTAYYNEFDPKAAEWLRTLITRGLIAPGEVDERSIEDVAPSDLAGFTQCHFFAGIGVWSYALRRAGWADDEPVWTGSCPCQPFSSAGKGDGFADERHLWPAFHHLIEQRRPRVVFGEQVEAAIRHSWLDVVQTDMEGSGYAFGAIGLPAAGFGAPHIRARIFFVGTKGLANANQDGRNSRSSLRPVCRQYDVEHGCDTWNVANANHEGLERRGRVRECSAELASGSGGVVSRPGPVNGHWRDADWIPCRDSKIRPVEPGTSPLVDGTATRMGFSGTVEKLDIPVMLRGYGNAICAPVAEEFIRAFMDVEANHASV